LAHQWPGPETIVAVIGSTVVLSVCLVRSARQPWSSCRSVSILATGLGPGASSGAVFCHASPPLALEERGATEDSINNDAQRTAKQSYRLSEAYPTRIASRF
jgi:hypothetical protein